jgi:serine/threonine protein kinase
MNTLQPSWNADVPATLAQIEFGGMNPSLPLQWLIIVAAFAVTALILMVMARWVVWPIFKGIGWFIGACFTFVGRTLRDLFKLTGAFITAAVLVPLVVGSLLIGRWSASNHFANSLKGELGLAGKCFYRLTAANFLTSFGMRDVVAGLEERIPQALADAPGSDLPHLAQKRGFIFEAEYGLAGKSNKDRAGVFDGYRIVGSLAGGGSGGKLYIADPDAIKVASYERNGHFGVGQVVIKSFSIRDGSSLPQIVRESQSLPAAKKLGLVLDHELTPERFFYVMRYVPGQSLSAVTHQLHAGSEDAAGKGLDDAALRTALGLVADLVATLDAYHRGGLWHKDVKPDNIIVDGTRAHLVDFGLVTPLRSAMTLTTHGTEYFRDPEMVKMALKGVKVHEVDGAKFDVYGAGAVLYSVIENSFPAHGVLSQISMRCPEALRWVVRRAMADYDKRYPTAGAMLRDLDAIRKAADPMAVKPGQLPSMQEDGAEDLAPPPMPEPMPMPVYASRPIREQAAATPLPGVAAAVGAVPPPLPNANPTSGASKPKVRLTNWLTGAFEVDSVAPSQPQAQASPGVPHAARRHAEGSRHSASEQLQRARSRASAMRDRARERMGKRAGSIPKPYSNNPNAGTYIAVASVLFLASMIAMGYLRNARSVGPNAPMRLDSNSGMSVTITDRDPSGRERRTTTPVLVEGGVEVGPVPAPIKTASAPIQRVQGKVALVVVDLKKPLDPGHDQTIRAAVARLREAGFEVRGEFPGAEPDDTDLELTASAIKAAGGLAVDTENGSSAVGRWIVQDEGTPSVVVWFKPRAAPRGEDPGVHAVVLGPAETMLPQEARVGAARVARAAREAVAR